MKDSFSDSTLETKFYEMVAVIQMLLDAENFKENAVENLKRTWKDQELTDVTLVSSDGFKLEAHKTVLR